MDQPSQLFIDLDTTSGGVFDRAGLLDADGFIGKPGTTLYITWSVRGKYDRLQIQEYAGLSLMHGDQPVLDEPLFVGKTAHSDRWASKHGIKVNELKRNGKSVLPDDAPHLFLVRIVFGRETDTVEVFLDPDLSEAELPEADAVLEIEAVNFDRLRIGTNKADGGFRFDNILITTNLSSQRLQATPIPEEELGTVSGSS